MKEKMTLLRDRLNDLSRRNRSIRMLKVYNKWTFDLNELEKVGLDQSEVVSNLVDKRPQRIVKSKTDDEESMILSKKLTTLFRNINSIEEETGLCDFYLGYPFLEGSMSDGTYVRAPLFLYPVRLERVKRHGVEWHVTPIDGEEPQLNRSLFLALQKFSGLHVTETLFEEAEEKSDSNDLSMLAEWLKGHSLQTAVEEDESFTRVRSFTREEIPTFAKGRFRLKEQAVIGHFPQGNSALLKDYEEFLKRIEEGETRFGMVSELLMLEGDETPQEVDNLPSGESSFDEKLEKEKSKFLVLDTDASQEQIIESVEKEKGIVVHGPPGTGKSQVIVNMISNAMANQKKVLLVTQKRAALDVVYQRLDSLGLSSNIALLHDEKHDRKVLYRKLHSLLSSTESYEDLEKELSDISNRLVKAEEKLNGIAGGLFEVQPHGYRAYDLYGKSKPAKEQEAILKLEGVLGDLDKHNLEDVLMKIFSYAGYYDRFGQKDYPLKDRKSFSALEMKDRVEIIELFEKVIKEARESKEHLEHFEDESITPEYSWQVDEKIEKIYDDLTAEEKKTLQKLRLWVWTNFTGKTIIEELLDGEKFKGTSSKEWPVLRKSLSILYELSKVSDLMKQNVRELNHYFSNEKVDYLQRRISKGDIPLSTLESQLNFVTEDFDDLREMDRKYDEGSKAVQTMIDQLKEKEISANLENRWKDIAEQSAYIYWIDQVERKHPYLSKVGTNDIEYTRQNLKELLEQKQRLSIRLLQNQMAEVLHGFLTRNSKVAKEIRHQTGKKRKVWPVRKLVNEYALNGLTDIMPVWLASPDIVSAIFPLEENMFDLVIFDEASQCTVENGIPSVYRGEKVVVAGDEKQLPPSSLFQGSVEVDEDDDFDDIEESESLLNLSKRVLPSHLLEWHYRSKSEELINFSNHAYYGGSIQIAPNVHHLKDPASLQWHKADGRWLNQRNTVEAKYVVQLLKDKLIENHTKSIGIITFNAKQQEAIVDEIDRLSEEDQEFAVIYDQVMGREMDERVFVKNIENVQGDERDIVIFSIAYAKNEEGRVYNRFGSLGMQGGENRLNVAVTRAKQEIHLVSSIEPSELNVTNSKHDGPRHLKAYMEYAQAVSKLNKERIESVLTELNEEMNTKRQNDSLDFDSPFEEEVYNSLTNIGYKVDTQIGMSGYRIDMAVVHPQNPDRYILGIECDGAMYHSAPSARERDVYRQRFLEDKGWKIARIWSRSWWKDAPSEVERIDQMLRKLVEEESVREEVRTS